MLLTGIIVGGTDDEGTAELEGVELVDEELDVVAELAEAGTTGVVLEESRTVLGEEEPLTAEVVVGTEGATEMGEVEEADGETEVKEEMVVVPGARVDVVSEVLVAPGGTIDVVNEVLVVDTGWSVQVCTSWTAGCPLLSVMGVRTIVHISTTGPVVLQDAS